MAGLKKPTRAKKDNTNPNTVLVIFLVFFVLLGIGLGVWGYYGYAGQDALRTEAKNKQKEAAAAKQAEDYYRMIAGDLRQAVGDALDPDERTFIGPLREEFTKEGFGKFKDEKGAAAVKKLMDENRAKFGFDAAASEYKDSYQKALAKVSEDAKTAEATLAKTQKDLEDARALFATLDTKQGGYWKAAMDRINENYTSLLKTHKAKTAEVEAILANNQELNTKLEEGNRQLEKVKADYDRQVRELTFKLQEKGQPTDVAVAPTRNPGEQHALLLDVSRGKPLWDQPLGKITRVDMGRRQVTINLGSRAGVRPGVTFSVFGAGAGGRAEKHLKGTVEVTSVQGPDAALANITALYGPDGAELDLNDQTRGRAQRESEAALRDGDLLFNMFWGSRVAIAGYVNLSGTPTDNPAEQQRQLSDFIYFLERQGMTVDAHIDLTDGQVKGALTPQTRYLIRGEDLRQAGKEADAEKAAGGDRAKAINDATAALRKEAAERGLFIVSAENLLHVTGYRRPGGSGQPAAGGFRPSATAAGGTFSAGGRRPAPSPEAKE